MRGRPRCWKKPFLGHLSDEPLDEINDTSQCTWPPRAHAACCRYSTDGPCAPTTTRPHSAAAGRRARTKTAVRATPSRVLRGVSDNLTFAQMADPPLIVRLIMRIAELPEEVARLILDELPRYCPTRGRLITTPTFGLPRPAPITLLNNVWPANRGREEQRQRRFRLPNLGHPDYRALVPSLAVPYAERRGRWGYVNRWGYLQ